jgi:hypothetical protein
MKAWVVAFGALWLLCGWGGAHWLGDHRLKTIALGPISLAKAYNDNPVSYPGPN